MADKKNCNECHCTAAPTNPSVCQTISEMDWEKGIWNAALSGEIDRIESIIRKSKNPEETVNEPDNSGYTALHYAARYGHVNICQLLLRNGAKINAQTKSGKATPLQKASVGGKLKAVQFLIQQGACLTTQDADGETALHKAMQIKNTEIVDFLLKSCPELVNIADNKGNIPVAKQ